MTEAPGQNVANKSGRILYICNDGYYFRQHRQHLALRMAAEGFDVHVAYGGEPDRSDDRVTVHPLTMERHGFSLPADWALARQLRTLVRNLRPDIVHIITMKPAVIAAAAFSIPLLPALPTPNRIVVTFPGLGRVFDDETVVGALRRRLSEKALRRLFKLTGAIATFENASDREAFVGRKIVAAGQTVLTAGAGLDLASFHRSRPHEKRPLRVLWASRLLRSKGLEPFVEAARMARAEGSDVEFWVAGYADPGHADGLSKAEIDAFKHDPSIRFLGHVTDMPELLAKVDALVLPSSYPEGIPRILIEGAAAGLALIVSDLPGCREIVEDGVTGMILPDNSSTTIWAAIRRLSVNREERERLGKAALGHVARRGFAQSSVQDAFISAYGLKAPLNLES